MTVHAFKNNSLLSVCLFKQQNYLWPGEQGPGWSMTYQFKWRYKNSYLIPTPSIPLIPLPLLEKEEVHFCFFILKFDILGVSMLSVIFQGMDASSERAFCSKGLL